MSITDELRLFAADPYTSWVPTDKQQTDLRAIADRIDAEHQKAEDEWRAKNGDMWLKGYAACHEELMEGHPVIAADLEKAGWVKLPVDADNVPWNVGDRDEDGNEVIALKLASDGWFVITDGEWLHRPGKHHYHAPTVEDVLRDFGVDIAHALGADPDATVPEATIAEYAAKLRLAKEDA